MSFTFYINTISLTVIQLTQLIIKTRCENSIFFRWNVTLLNRVTNRIFPKTAIKNIL